MPQSHRRVFARIGAALVFGLGLSATATAQDHRSHDVPLHGGKVAMTKAYHFEVVFAKDGAKVYPRTHQDKPLDTSKLSGTATFYHPNSPKPWFDRPLHVASPVAGQAPRSLDLVISLVTVPLIGANATFEIAGLPDSVKFSVPFEFAKIPAKSSAMHPVSFTEEVATSPRNVYGPGDSGFGRYQYPSPEAAPVPGSRPSVYNYGTPGGRNSSGSSGASRDWSTGRDFQSGGLISKPWLR
jgi:hypothetical protein